MADLEEQLADEEKVRPGGGGGGGRRRGGGGASSAELPVPSPWKEAAAGGYRNQRARPVSRGISLLPSCHSLYGLGAENRLQAPSWGRKQSRRGRSGV